MKWSRSLVVASLLLLLALSIGQAPLGYATRIFQGDAPAMPSLGNPSPSPAGPELTLTFTDLLKLNGTVVAQGKNDQPVGQFRVKTYRIEELQLPNGSLVNLNGTPVRADQAWRVTITGGPFPVRALPPVLSVGATRLGFGQESADLTEITFLTLDRSALRAGTALALSYGLGDEERSELPEPITFGTGR